MFGYRSDEVIGKHVSILFSPDRLAEETVIIEKSRHGESLHHLETFRHRKDGTPVPVSLTISPIIGADGQILGASEIVRDVSERQQARAKVHEIQSELFHVSWLNTVSHMASGLAHTLNQPLSAISNYVKGTQRLLDKRTDEWWVEPNPAGETIFRFILPLAAGTDE